MSDKGREAIDRIEQNLMEPADIEKHLRSHGWLHEDDVVEEKGRCYGDYGCPRDVMQGIHGICPYSNCRDCDRYNPATIKDLIGKE